MPNVNTLPGQHTIGLIRQLVADAAYQPPQMTQPGYVGDISYDMSTRMIRQSYQEFIGTLVTRYESLYINTPGSPFSFTTDGKNYQFALPNDFDKGLRVDLWLQPGNSSSAITLKRFMNLETNQQNFLPAPAQSLGWEPRYRFVGNVIEFDQHPPQQGLQIVIYYIPYQTDLCDLASITCSGVQSNDQIILWTGSALPTTGGIFPVPPTNSQSYFPGLYGVTGFPPVSTGAPALQPVATYTAIAINAVPSSPTEFNIGVNDTETATSLAACIANSAQNAPWTTLSQALDNNIVSVSSAGNIVQLQLLAPLAMIIQSYNLSDDAVSDHFGIDPLPVPSFMNPYGAFTNVCTVLTGMDEYIVQDVAEKIMGRLERDPSLYAAKKAEILHRIQTEAQNRDAGQSFRITRVRGRRTGYSSWTGR